MSTDRNHRRGHGAEVILAVVGLYSFAGWVYIAANAVVHPETLPLPLTHLAGWPREDNFGIACFAISFISTLSAAALRARR